MKKLISDLPGRSKVFFATFMLCLLGISAQVSAQYLPASSYGFTAQSANFTEITGGTTIPDIHFDDAVSSSLPIGFTFNFCGTNYQDFVISSNGWISFNNTVNWSIGYNSQADLNDLKPALFPLWDDVSGSIGEARYEVSGTAPNRILTVQCKDWRWNYSSAYGATISYQVKLYETTNVIEYIYRQETDPGNTTGSDGATIGITDAAAAATFLVINNSSAAPVASAATFTTDITARPASGQLYRFTPPPPCNPAMFPATATATASPSSICTGGSAQLGLGFTPPLASGVTYQWQSAANAAGPFTNIAGATGLSYIASNINANTYYRCQVLCSGSPVLTSSVAEVITTAPGTVTANGGSRCGPGSVQLTAAPADPTNQVHWYQSQTGGSVLFTGNTFNTPAITGTTTFYAAAGIGAGSIQPTWIGSGTGVIDDNPNPYYTYYEGLKTQYLIRASELISLGFSAGNITELAFDVVDAGGHPLSNFYISMKQTAATELTTAWETGLTTVYTAPATFTPTANSANVYTFQNPISWNGVSNLVIEVCFNNPDWSSGHSVKYTDNLGFNASHYYQEDGNPTLCSAPGSGDLLQSRPNIRLGMSGCESARVPVVATINPAPAVNIGADLDTCVAGGTTITLEAGPQPNNGTYLWDDGSVAGSRVVGQTGIYYVAVTNSFGCVGRDTINVRLKINPVVELAPGDTISLCGGGVTVLDAGPGGLNGGRYYWNTGDDTRTIDATSAGSYIAYVTSAEGCRTVDTVEVVVVGQMPQTDGIMVTPQSVFNFTFTADNPLHVIQYTWDYGDGSPQETTAGPTTQHAYTANGNYWVKLYTNSTCGQIADSILVTIIGGVGVADIDKDAGIRVYPNPAYDHVVFIETEPAVVINDLKVYNMAGQEVFSRIVIDKNSNKHRLALNKDLAAGIYYIKVFTNKGTVNKKLELLK